MKVYRLAASNMVNGNL